MTRTRRLIVIIIVIFLLYAIIKSPDTAAHYVRVVMDWFGAALQHIFSFFDALLNKK